VVAIRSWTVVVDKHLDWFFFFFGGVYPSALFSLVLLGSFLHNMVKVYVTVHEGKGLLAADIGGVFHLLFFIFYLLVF